MYYLFFFFRTFERELYELKKHFISEVNLRLNRFLGPRNRARITMRWR